MKGRKSAGRIIYSIVNAALGLAVGAAAALMSPMMQDIRNKSFGRYLLDVAVTMLSLLLAFLIQIVIHEAGHLVFGLMSGYRFNIVAH